MNGDYQFKAQLDNSYNTRLFHLWGKTSGPDEFDFHPAVYHLLDVGNVARELLSDRASPRWRNMLANTLGDDPENLVNWVPTLIALHDIGKISASFQSQNAIQRSRLIREGFQFSERSSLHHQQIGFAIVSDLLAGNLKISDELMHVIRDTVGGHHGYFTASGDLKNIRSALAHQEVEEWKEMRRQAFEFLTVELRARFPENLPGMIDQSAAIMSLTGFMILCDWLGSDEKSFPPALDQGFGPYPQLSQQRAQLVVRQAGFFQTVHSTAPILFRELFFDLPSPRPLQLTIDSIPDTVLSQPCLVVIEAPTGEGKTEAALALAHRIAAVRGTDELYYALPTMATSNQMYLRVQKYLQKQLGLSSTVRLVHGQAWLIEDDLHLKLSGDNELEAAEWFEPKKRALLAPFGVGTIDQAELGALNVKHNALRLVGLAGKVLILDEVHAYDMYMTTIVEKLLKWLSVLGTSVILLSATLPRTRRQALLAAFGASYPNESSRLDLYPAVSISSRLESWQANPHAVQPERRIQLGYLKFKDDNPHSKAGWLLKNVQGGGCAVWITNTVERAQQIFRALREMASEEVDLILLHARFPLNRRQEIEDQLVGKYGPNGENRPRQGIVVGTQVLEQSLDLDFDVMISDIAPVDLLLQRAGRLHRHSYRDRPTTLKQPCLWINRNEDDQGNLEPGVDGLIYSDYLVTRTWEILCNQGELRLPADYRTLVEQVYDITPPDKTEPLWVMYQKLQDKEWKAVREARLRLLPDPDPQESFCSMVGLPFEEDENRTDWMIAQTRLTEESMTVIPLEKINGKAVVWDSDVIIELEKPASRENQVSMLRHNIRVSHRGMVQGLHAVELPKVFKASPLLKGALPLWLENGNGVVATRSGELRFSLDHDLGLVIQRKGEM